MTEARPPIAFYFDIFSPFANLASHRIDALAAKHGRATDWRPVLVGVTVLKVMGMKPLMEYPLKGDYLRRDALRLARMWNIPFRFHGLKGHNSLNAMRAFVWLKTQDPALAKRFAQAMFARLWQRGEDITPPEASLDEAAALGIDRDELAAALSSPQVKQALQDDVNAAVEAGVFGVPFFIADGEPFFGCDHLHLLDHWLTHGSWDASA